MLWIIAVNVQNKNDENVMIVINYISKLEQFISIGPDIKVIKR